MGKCPNCGKGGFRAKTVNCKVCGKEGCETCFVFVFTIKGLEETGDDYDGKNWDYWYVCSNVCSEKLASKFAEYTLPSDVDAKIERLVLRAIQDPRNKDMISDRLGRKIEALKRKYPECNLGSGGLTILWAREIDIKADGYCKAGETNPFYKVLVDKQKQLVKNFEARQLEYAKVMEKARRFEDAAHIYEGYGMYEDAGRARARDKEILVKRTDLSIDINQLLQQVKDSGLVYVYRCPHCGGSLKIEKNATAESLRTCEHCGSEIKAIDIVDFLNAALS